MIKFDGIGYTIPSTDLVVGRAPDSPIARQILLNFSPKRSGDIYIIYEPHWYATADGDVVLVNHGSPWRNKTFLPIVFAGSNVRAARGCRRVEAVDIAATLGLIWGLSRPRVR